MSKDILKKPEKVYKTFEEFYPFYLKEHSNRTNRRLHVIGTTAALIFMIYIILSGSWWILPLFAVPGYFCAWIGHFIFEKNKPATFKYPIWSFRGDLIMWFDHITGKRKF